MMARIGHIHDDEIDRWLPEVDYMRRRGYRLWQDRWLSREEHAARLRAHEEAEKRRRDDARQERITRAIEALVVTRLSRQNEPEPEVTERPGPLVAVYGGYSYPRLAVSRVVRPVGFDPETRGTFDDLARRQPGSILPIRPRPSRSR